MMKPPKAAKDEVQQASGLVNTVEMGDSAYLEKAWELQMGIAHTLP